jgi:hypothetical protein
MESLLKELPNGGAVVAIIVVVILFLREQTASRKDYLEHLRALTGIRMPDDKQAKYTSASQQPDIPGQPLGGFPQSSQAWKCLLATRAMGLVPMFPGLSASQQAVGLSQMEHQRPG